MDCSALRGEFEGPGRTRIVFECPVQVGLGKHHATQQKQPQCLDKVRDSWNKQAGSLASEL